MTNVVCPLPRIGRTHPRSPLIAVANWSRACPPCRDRRLLDLRCRAEELSVQSAGINLSRLPGSRRPTSRSRRSLMKDRVDHHRHAISRFEPAIPDFDTQVEGRGYGNNPSRRVVRDDHGTFVTRVVWTEREAWPHHSRRSVRHQRGGERTTGDALPIRKRESYPFRQEHPRIVDASPAPCDNSLEKRDQCRGTQPTRAKRKMNRRGSHLRSSRWARRQVLFALTVGARNEGPAHRV